MKPSRSKKLFSYAGPALLALVLLTVVMFGIRIGFGDPPPPFPAADASQCPSTVGTVVSSWCLGMSSNGQPTTQEIWTKPAVPTQGTGLTVMGYNGTTHVIGSSCGDATYTTNTLIIPVDNKVRWLTSFPGTGYPYPDVSFAGFVSTPVSSQTGSSGAVAHYAFEMGWYDGTWACTSKLPSSPRSSSPNYFNEINAHAAPKPSAAALADPSFDRNEAGYLIITGWSTSNERENLIANATLSLPTDQVWETFNNVIYPPYVANHSFITAASGPNITVINRDGRKDFLKLQMLSRQSSRIAPSTLLRAGG